MSAAAEIGLTFSREMRRNVGSVKGLVSSLLFLLGGAGALMLYVSFSREMNDLTHGNADAMASARREVLRVLYDDAATADYLAAAPPALFWLYKTTLFFLPMLVILIGYDQLAGDLQYRTIRYATVRAHRESLVTGKALATWAAAAIIAFALHGFAWVITIARGDATAGATLSYGLRFWAATVIFSAGFVGLTSLLSGAFKTPMLALLMTFTVAFAWWLLRLIVHMDSLKDSVGWLAKIVPGEWEPRLVAPDLGTAAVGVLVLFAFGVAGVAGACGILRGRDV